MNCLQEHQHTQAGSNSAGNETTAQGSINPTKKMQRETGSMNSELPARGRQAGIHYSSIRGVKEEVNSIREEAPAWLASEASTVHE